MIRNLIAILAVLCLFTPAGVMAATMTIGSDPDTLWLSDYGWEPPEFAWVHPLWVSIPGAAWIWPYYRVVSSDQFGPYDFQREFSLPDDISDVTGTIQVSSDDVYSLSINGELIADEVNAVRTTNTYPFTPEPGYNIIEFTVYNILEFGVDPDNNPAGILYRADISYTPGGNKDGTKGSDCNKDIFAEAGKNGLEWSNPTRGFGDSDEVNYWIPFNFTIGDPEEIEKAYIFMKVKPIGNLIGTDTLTLKGASGKAYDVYTKFSDLEANTWNEPEGVDISGNEDIMAAIKTGKLEGMIQDDTAVSWVILNVCYQSGGNDPGDIYGTTGGGSSTKGECSVSYANGADCYLPEDDPCHKEC
jgi:hypothetical protein